MISSLQISGEHCLLLTTSAYAARKDRDGNMIPPTKTSSLITVAISSVILVTIERLSFHVLRALKFLHPILEDELHCKILACNLGVRALSTLIVTIQGIRNRHIFSDITSLSKCRKNMMNASDRDKRLFMYHPEAHQCALFFCSYQIINLVYSIINEEEFIHKVHHSAAAITAWIFMYPGFAHFYAMASSITDLPAFLASLQINFDDGGLIGHVPGLGTAFPTTKLILNILVGISFVCCRIFFWFFAMYHLIKDMNDVVINTKQIYQTRRPYFLLYKVCICTLGFLQLFLLFIVCIKAPSTFDALLDNKK